MSKFKFEVAQQIGRSISYALTSGVALLSGIILQSKSFLAFDLLELGLFLFFLSMPFFIVYSIIYDYYGKGNKEDVILLGSIITILFGGIVFLIFKDKLIQYYPTFTSYCFIFALAALYISNQNEDRGKLIRNQLIFPTLFSIGVSLYYGLNLTNLSHDISSYYPLIIFSLFFLISVKFCIKKKSFIILSGSSLIILFTFVNYISFGLSNSIVNYFTTFLFSIFIALYLSIFEAWRITAYQAKIESNIIDKEGILALMNIKAYAIIPSAYKYSQSILIGCVVTIAVVPFTFIYTNYGAIFLGGFLIWSSLTIIYWSIKSQYAFDLLKSTWVFKKGVAGFLFLFILVLGSKFYVIHKYAILNSIVNISFFSVIILLFSAVPFRNLIKSYQSNAQDGFWDTLSNMFKQRINFFRSLIIFISIMMGLLYLFHISITSPDDPVKLRVEYSFGAYCLLLFLFFIIEVTYNLSKKHPKIQEQTMKILKTLPMILGIIRSSRIVTSLFIALLVFTPLYSFGNDIYISIEKSLPFFLAGIIGFSLNDFFDFERDIKNKPYRPLPMKQISRTLLLQYSIFVIILSLFFSYFIADSHTELFYFYTTIFGVILYNAVVKYFSPIKNFYSAFISSLPIFYFIWFLDLHSYFYFFPISSFLFIVGRELLMDILDIKGDKETGLLTLPIIFPQHESKLIAFCLQICSLPVLLPILFANFSILKLFIFLLISFLLLLSIYFWNKKTSHIFRINIIKFQWIHIFLGICFIIL